MSHLNEPSRVELHRSWRAVLDHLGREMNRHMFETWVSGTEPLRLEDNHVIIEARHGTDPAWLNKQLCCIIDRAVAVVFGDGIRAKFIARSDLSQASPEISPTASPLPAAASMSAAGRGRVIGTINSHYTFERYLRTSGNAIALESCLALLGPAPQPASPVVLYGEPGLGKTHLLHALAARAVGQGWSVACLGAEEFTNRYQSAIRNNSVQALQESLRSVQLLLIDDLQYLPGRTATVGEFINTCDAVTNAGGVVACASERHPGELELPPRLISRLKGGVLARMTPLTPLDCRAYVNARVREHRLSLPGWAIDRIAACGAPSVRVLQGVVNNVLMLQRTGEFDQARLDAHIIEVCATAAVAPAGLDLHGVIEAVASHFAIALDDLVGRSRQRSVADARAIAMAALVARGQSLAQVGVLFTHRDRSTVKEASDRGRKLLEANPALRMRLVS